MRYSFLVYILIVLMLVSCSISPSENQDTDDSQEVENPSSPNNPDEVPVNHTDPSYPQYSNTVSDGGILLEFAYDGLPSTTWMGIELKIL